MVENSERPVLQLSLKEYALNRASLVNKALERQAIQPFVTIVFGSAVDPRDGSQSTQLNPKRWDIDTLIVVDTLKPLEATNQLVLVSGEVYRGAMPIQDGSGEMQLETAMHYKSPSKGLHLQLIEQDELLRDSVEDLYKYIFEHGVLVHGSIDPKLQQHLANHGIQVNLKQPDEASWSALSFVMPSSNRII